MRKIHRHVISAAITVAVVTAVTGKMTEKFFDLGYDSLSHHQLSANTKGDDSYYGAEASTPRTGQKLSSYSAPAATTEKKTYDRAKSDGAYDSGVAAKAHGNAVADSYYGTADIYPNESASSRKNAFTPATKE